MTAKLVCALATTLALTGCSIRIQAPVREVAYDFSDRDFYDRAYAPSPAYATSATAPLPPATPRPADRSVDRLVDRPVDGR